MTLWGQAWTREVPWPSCGNIPVSCAGAALGWERQCNGAEETRRPARALLWSRQSEGAACTATGALGDSQC